MKQMQKITFFTIHQAPHNTFTFKCLDDLYNLEIFYLDEKIGPYGWQKKDFYYPGKIKKDLITYIKSALNTDFSIISGWQNYRYIILTFILLLFRRNFCLYLDLSPDSLRKFGWIKKLILKKIPYVFITGLYGEKYLKKYLKRENAVFDFPYGVALPDSKEVEETNRQRIEAIKNGDKIRVFISNRFIERKGYNLVRILVSYLKEKKIIDNFQFIIAGNGPLFEKEREMLMELDENIKFLGWIEYSQYHEQMKQCDIFLHCSKFEPYGIPPIDAFTYKKEIVITNTIYSRWDITARGGKVHKFNYNDEKAMVGIFEAFTKNRDKIYQSNRDCRFEGESPYLFFDKFRKVIDKVTGN